MYRPISMPNQIDKQLLMFCEPYTEIALDAFMVLMRYTLPLVQKTEKIIAEQSQDLPEAKLLSSLILACKGPLNGLFKQLCVLRKYEASPQGLWLKIKELYIQDKGVELSMKQLHQQSLTLDEVIENIDDFALFFPTEFQGYCKQIYVAFLSYPFFLEQDKEWLNDPNTQISYLDKIYHLYLSQREMHFWDKIELNQWAMVEKTTMSDLLICIVGLRQGKIGAVHLLFQSLMQRSQTKSIKITQAENALTSILQHPNFLKLQQLIKKKSEDVKPQLPTQEIAQESNHIEEKDLEEVQPSLEKKESYKIIRHFTPKFPKPPKETDDLDFATHLTSPVNKLDLSIEPQHTPLPGDGDGKRLWRIEEKLSGFIGNLKDDPVVKIKLEESRTWKVRFRKGSVYKNGALKWSKADWSIYHPIQKPKWLEDQLNQQGNLLKLLQLEQLNFPSEWGWDEESNRYYVISNLLSGPNLMAYLSQNVLDPKEKIDLLMPVLKHLSILHAMGIAHGNIKGNNLIFHEKKLFLTDFHLISSLFPGGSRQQRELNLMDCAPELKAIYEKAIQLRNQGKNIDTPYHFSSVAADLFAISKLLRGLLGKNQEIDHLNMDIQLAIKELGNSKVENRLSLQEAIYLLDPTMKPKAETLGLKTGTTLDAQAHLHQAPTSFMPLFTDMIDFHWEEQALHRFRLFIDTVFLDFILVKPEHEVAFLMSVTPVTQSVWYALMKDNPSIFSNPSFPIDSVSYDDSIAFCQRLNHYISEQEDLRKLKIIADLPLLAQWEICARAGKKFDYSGSMNLDEVGWYVDNAKGSLQVVALKKPNAWGFYDLSGNVWEWIKNEDHHADEVITVGGSWLDPASQCKIGVKRSLSPQFTSLDQGFRVCLKTIELA